jgi:hypothetical protein
MIFKAAFCNMINHQLFNLFIFPNLKIKVMRPTLTIHVG